MMCADTSLGAYRRPPFPATGAAHCAAGRLPVVRPQLHLTNQPTCALVSPSHQVLPTALRGAFQSCGQNCAGAERFIVHEKVFDEFVR